MSNNDSIMAEEDPWSWSVDRVVQEFCTDQRSWVQQTYTHSLPDLTKLENDLREQEVTGTVLLEHFDHSLLKDDFGISVLGQRVYILGAVDQIRKMSLKYNERVWEKTASFRDPSIMCQFNREPGSVFIYTGDGHKRLRTGRVEGDDTEIMDNGTDLGQQDIVDKAIPPPEPPVPVGVVANGVESGKKRRRIAPTLITPVVDKNRNREVPTNADHIIKYDPKHPEKILHSEKQLSIKSAKQTAKDAAVKKAGAATVDLAKGYLGNKKMPIDSIFYDGRGLIKSGDEANFASSSVISAGRRLYVNKAMKSFLLSQPQAFLRNKTFHYAVCSYDSHLVPKHLNPAITVYHKDDSGRMIVRKEPLTSWPEVDPEASKNARRFESLAAGLDENQDTFDPETLIRHNDSPGAEEIFPVYGESDEENEYDEKTWREIEEEQGTLGRPRMALKKQVISEEEAIQAIDEAVAEMVDDWRLRKFPKRQHKAFGVWRKYSKQPALQVNRLKAIATRLDHFKEDRIPKLHEEILKQPFTSQKQVKKQALSMETTIHDRQSLLWEQAIITQRQAPVRLPPRPRASKALKKTVAFLGDDEDGESIGSYENTSSSDSIDNFIVSGSEDELLELNLADGEKVEVGVEVEEDRDDGDSIEALDIDVDVTDASFPKTSTPAASTAIETTVRNPGFDLQPEREPGLAPVTPRKPRPVASVSMSPIVISSDEEAVRFHDLTIPQRKPTTNIMLKMPKPADKRESISLISDSDETTKLTDVGNLPRLDDPVSIGRYPVKEWIRIEDRERLVIAVLQRIAVGPRTSVVALASTLSTKQMWTDMTNTLEVLTAVDKNTLNGQSQESYEGTKYLLRLFWIYVTCKNQNVKLIKKGKATIEEGYDKYFSSFHALCKDFERGFGKAINADANYDDDDNDVEDEGPRSATQRKPQSTSPEYDAQSHSQMSVKKKLYKAKKLVEDATACDMRKCNQERLVEQEARRAEVRKDFPQFDGTQHDNIIINETKASHEGLITVNDGIGRLIKPHQVDGVRFMWNEVVAGQQGCLLAHTMGLGKTMQAITLLVAIAEASQSPDETISSQIPESLRTTKTLILCPPSLINNWMDELYFWVPKDLLVLQKVDVQYPAIQRLSIIKHWFENGGVLVMGYNMFSTLIHNKDTDERLAPLSKELHAEAKTHLLEGPSTIVADEAHKMKNVTAQISQAASQFKSLHRIALTGSPLSNNVLEYYSMIDWAVPGYFGPLKEFRQKYVVPIEEGLYEDSTSYQRRKSVKWLEILKSDVGPKINRANMSVLSKDLPPKKEFVVNVPLTNLQVKAYSLYVKEMQTSKPHQLTKDGGITNSTLWTWLAILRLICNHPACCKAQLLQRKNKTKTPVLPKKNEKGESSAATETTENDEDLGAGVSQSLIQQLSALFQSETNDIQEPTLSNKVTVLCQILDASKAAGDKVLLFTQSLHTITYLEKLFALQGRFYMKLDGKTLTSKRQAMVKEFNEGDAEIYLISTTAGGLGLNLQGANRVVIFDFKWNPTEETQAIGRAYRFGQKKPVFVYRFVAGGTFEGIVFNKMVFKTQLASRVIDCRRPNPKASILPSDYLFEPKSVEQKELDWVRGKDPQVLDYILNNHAEASTIREILETDSFEEELNDDLHPDDRKEVEIESKRAYLKRTNPAEYARQVKHKALAEQKAQQVAHQNAIAQQHGQKLTYQSPHYGAQQNGQKTPRQYSQHLPIVPGSTINSKTPNAEAQAVPATSASGPSHKVLSREVSMPFFDALTEALGDQAKALELRNPIIRHFSKRYGLDNDAAICDAVNLATNQLKLARGRYKSGSLDDKVFARAIIDSIESKKQAAIASLKTTLQRAVTSPAGPKTSGIPTNTLTAEASSSKTGPVVSTALTINNAELPVILKATAPATDNANTLEFAPKGFTRMTISNDKPAVNPAADTYEPNISNGSVNANVHVNGNGKIPKTSPERTARPSVLISPVPSEDTSDTESIQNVRAATSAPVESSDGPSTPFTFPRATPGLRTFIVDTFQAIAAPPPTRSLREPVTKHKQKGPSFSSCSSSRKSSFRVQSQSRHSTPTTKLPKWAEKEIKDASNGTNRQNSRPKS